MKDCEKYTLLIDELADGEISDSNRLELSAHMKDCLECSIAYEQVLMLKEKTKKIPAEIKPAQNVWNRINETITEDNIEVKQVAANFYSIVNTAPNQDSAPLLEEVKNEKPYFKYIIAACIIVFLGLVSITFMYRSNSTNPDATAFAYWQVTKVKGNPVINDDAGNSVAFVDSIKAGDWIETNDSSKAIITIAGLGEITIEPKSKLKILTSDKGEHKVLLEFGTINTNFSQKSDKFAIETKNSTARDNNVMATAYTFSVDNKGDGMILVKDGSVTLESRGKEAVVPAGKVCLVQAITGPGTPFSVNASTEFRNALYTYDFTPGGQTEIYNVINSADKSDMISLINLIPRVNDEVKEQIYSKVSGYVTPPSYIVLDSLRYLDCEKLGEWIEKCQEQVWQNLDKSLEHLDERIRVKIEKDMGANFDVGIFTQELNKEIEENLKNALENLDMSKVEIEKQKDYFKNNNFNFNWGFNGDSLRIQIEKYKDSYNYNYEFDSEEFKQDMKELEEDLKQSQQEMQFDREEAIRDLEEAQREIEEAKEEVRRELQEMQEEQRQEQQELQEEQRREQQELQEELRQEREQERQEREQERREQQEEQKSNSGTDI